MYTYALVGTENQNSKIEKKCTEISINCCIFFFLLISSFCAFTLFVEVVRMVRNKMLELAIMVFCYSFVQAQVSSYRSQYMGSRCW